ncbi:MAG: GNAT family N-acetyltransferase, partial [Bacteroidota bacterium]|nr:GNAT family N-acetyltransferase [Bacteroidota bacterium]
GFVKLLCVADSYRRQGIASSLYLQIEEIFKREGVAEIRVYDSVPNYFMPGIDPFYTEAICFFERRGFVKFNDTCNLLADLLNDTFDTGLDEERLLKDGILVKRACKEDKTMLMDFINKHFEGWAGEVTSSFNNSPKTIFIAVQNDEVIAFSAHEGNNKGTGWFGPMGTNPGIRKKGVGGVLLKKCLKDLKEMGFVKAIIPWVGPIPFYMHYANAKVNRIFWRYKKIIN